MKKANNNKFGIRAVTVSAEGREVFNSRKQNRKEMAIAFVLGFLSNVAITFFILLTGINSDIKKLPADRKLTENVEAYIAITETLNYYREIGFDNGYCKDREHLGRIWDLCRKYEYLAKDTTWMLRTNKSKQEKEYLKRQIEKTDFKLFMFMVCMDETNYNPEDTYKNTNGTTDCGITQINQINLDGIQSQLPPGLQEKPWTCPEKNIAGRFIWIRDRMKMEMPWSGMTKNRGWKLYDKIRTATTAVEARRK